VDSKHRRELKEDKFAQGVGASVSWIDHHKPTVIRYGGIAIAAILIIGGIWYYFRYQNNAREEALADALKIDNAQVIGSAQPVPGVMNFATQAEKDKARTKAFTELVAKYHGTQEGAIAQMYMASDAVDKSDFANAERIYKDVVDSAPRDLAAMAQLSLAKVYAAENKTADAEKLLRGLIAKPAGTVSKEQATLHLAKLLIKDRCSEARKLLEPLRMERTAVSRAAVTALSEPASCPN